MRCCARGLISGRTRGNCVPCAIDEVPSNACRRCCREFCGDGKSGTSSMVFHAPQSGHLPTHLLCSPPHCWQIYFVRVFAMRNTILEQMRGDNAVYCIVSPHLFYPLFYPYEAYAVSPLALFSPPPAESAASCV